MKKRLDATDRAAQPITVRVPSKYLDSLRAGGKTPVLHSHFDGGIKSGGVLVNVAQGGTGDGFIPCVMTSHGSGNVKLSAISG